MFRFFTTHKKNLAALDRRVGAESSTDDFAQRLGAVDDEQPADFRVEPAFNQIVDQRLHDGGVLGCSLDQTKRMLVAFTIDGLWSKFCRWACRITSQRTPMAVPAHADRRSASLVR